MENGVRKRVLFYLLFNNNDIGNNVPGMSQAVREFCLTDSCLKDVLREYFDIKVVDSPKSDWCCSNCLGLNS